MRDSHSPVKDALDAHYRQATKKVDEFFEFFRFSEEVDAGNLAVTEADRNRLALPTLDAGTPNFVLERRPKPDESRAKFRGEGVRAEIAFKGDAVLAEAVGREIWKKVTPTAAMVRVDGHVVEVFYGFDLDACRDKAALDAFRDVVRKETAEFARAFADATWALVPSIDARQDELFASARAKVVEAVERESRLREFRDGLEAGPGF